MQELTAEQAMALANTSREHGGVLVFTEGGLALGIAVEFSDLLSTDEARAAELNAQRQDGRQVFVRKGRVVS